MKRLKTNVVVKFLSIVMVVISVISMTGCSGVVDETKYDYTVSVINSAYQSMLERSNVAAQYSLYGIENPRTVHIEFGRSSYIYGVDSILEGDKISKKTFFRQNNIWYLNDGKNKIAVASTDLDVSLWMVEMTVTDYQDLLACVNPERILARNFTVDPFVITKTQGSLVSLYTVMLNSSFMDKKELYVNNFYTPSMGNLSAFSGKVEYYVEFSGILQEVRLEIECKFSNSDEIYKVVLSVRQIDGVYRMDEDELRGYEIR